MFTIGEVVDGKYRVEGVCSDIGGMGGILHVTDILYPPPFPLVIKFCRSTDENLLLRFRREVRLLLSLEGNERVVQIVAHNLESLAPYFVMRYYPDGDLQTLAPDLRNNQALQETTFLQMIACIQTLHDRHIFHRDIKPANFLRYGSQLVVSDLGLSSEMLSSTACTSTHAVWGTQGYLPPEFFDDGGFRNADASGDIFMLGKTFYVLLTGRNPLYVMNDNLAPALFNVLSRCCNPSKSSRYQTLSELKQALVSAFDVLLQRARGVLQESFSTMRDRLAVSNQYETQEVQRFVDQLALADPNEQRQYVLDLPETFFSVVAQPPLADRLVAFLHIFKAFVESGDYSFSYAEIVARRMKLIFQERHLSAEVRSYALSLAIRAATLMNRFAAMDACRALVSEIQDGGLANHVAALILQPDSSFLGELEPSACKNETIRNAIRTIRGATTA